MIIRRATAEDCAAIADIFNYAVVHTAAIWNDTTVDTENRLAWFFCAAMPVTRCWSRRKTTSWWATPRLATGARLMVFAIP